MKNKQCPERKFCFGYEDSSCEGCVFGNAITKLHKRIDRLKKQKETLTIQRNAWALTAKAMENKWIPVDERLPEEDGRYLVCVEISHLAFAIPHIVAIRGYNKIHGFDTISVEETVTHWMPLPEAPKMKGGAE